MPTRLGRSRYKYRGIQPISQNSLSELVSKVFQIGLYRVVEADLELLQQLE